MKGDITLNSDQTAADTVLTFGSDSANETLTFKNNEDRFEFSDDLRTTGSLYSSGGLIVDSAAILKSTLKLNGVTYTFPTSDGAASGKVLKTNSAGVLSWSADDGGTGITETSGDARYVNSAGDTMTGALSIVNAAGLTASGQIRTDSDIIASGSLVIDKGIRGGSGGNLGWVIKSQANQACDTTCVSACVLGFASAGVSGSDPVVCTDATADSCLCAGGS